MFRLSLAEEFVKLVSEFVDVFAHVSGVFGVKLVVAVGAVVFGVAGFASDLPHIRSIDECGVACGAVCVGVRVDVAVVVVVPVVGALRGGVEIDGFVAVWAVDGECLKVAFSVVDVARGFIDGVGLSRGDGVVAVCTRLSHVEARTVL